jgi:hypothetical protein
MIALNVGVVGGGKALSRKEKNVPPCFMLVQYVNQFLSS